MARIELAGIPVDLERHGAGQPLLYLHPEHFFSHQQPFVSQLAKTREVAVPRHPRFFADCPAGGLRSLDDLAYLYLDLLEALDWKDVLIVGSSFGAWVALEMAVRDTSRIEALVLISPIGTKFGGRDDREFADLFALPEAEVRNALFHDANAGPDFEAMTAADFTAHAIEREAVGHYAWKPHLHNPVLARWLHRVNRQTLVVRGQFDGYVEPNNTTTLVQGLPHAKLENVGDCGHYPQVEKPQETSDLINAFVAGLGQGWEVVR